ncbi:MAG TPA: M23 family metallopeptidase [Mycetocola sp.]|nr:M23 family metallopeptidase [Mycetocola sp.]
MTASPRRPLVPAAILTAAVVTFVLAGPASAAGRPAPTARASSTASPAWGWPVSPPHQLARPFEAPPTPYSAGHRGVDVTAAPGRAVLSPADGVVSFAGMVVDRPVLSVRHDDGLVSSMEPVSASVTAGAEVRAGDNVGVVASGGHCDDRCMHFGARLHGEYVNPMALLGLIERSVLLPLGS